MDEAFARGTLARRSLVLRSRRRGHDATFTTTLQLLHDAEGRVWGLLVIAVEITDRTRATRRLESEILARVETEHRVEALTDLVPQIVWTTTRLGEVDWANHRFDEYVGPAGGGGATLRERFRAAVHAEDLPRVTEAWERSLATETPFEREYRMRRHDGVY